MSVEGIQFVVAFIGTICVAVFLARRAKWSLVLAVVGAMVSIWQLESRQARPPAEEKVINRPIVVQDDQYVSSKTCQACHPAHYETWYNSYHRTMTQVATPDTVIGDFNGDELTFLQRKYRMTREGDQFFLETVRGVGGRSDKRPIVMTTGFHHMQAYWTPAAAGQGRGRELSLAPFVYLREDKRWIPEPSSFLRSPHHLTEPQSVWNYSCQACHATGSQPRVATMDTRVGELGIACEACHGPAEEHVRANQDPLQRYRSHASDEPDPTIVNPARLDTRRASEVCGQCHSISHPASAAEDRALMERGATYRPGDVLADSMVTFHAANRNGPEMNKAIAETPSFFINRFWPDGMVRVSGREYSGLLDTPCFNHGDPEKERLSCIHCHQMHPPADEARSHSEWANDQLGRGMETNEACLRCHTELRTGLEEHTHHPAGSTGSLCYNCHMPYTTYGLLKAIRSHTIDSPSVTASIETGRPNACNQCHLDKTLAWTAEHLDEWYGAPKPTLNADQQSIAASLLWSLTGDAGQRALMAWSMGWSAAQAASGRDWLIIYAALFLEDPYDAVRYIGYRSLRRLPRCSDIEYDFTGPKSARAAALNAAATAWREYRGPRSTGSAILIDESGRVNQEIVQRLRAQRNDRRIDLQE